MFVLSRKGKMPHLVAREPLFLKDLRKMPAIEPIIGHPKNDHRMNHYRYKGVHGGYSYFHLGGFGLEQEENRLTGNRKRRKCSPAATEAT